MRTSPAAILLKKAAGLASGANNPGREKVGTVKRSQVIEIAKQKKEDLNARNDEAAIKIITGTAQSMGIEVIDE